MYHIEVSKAVGKSWLLVTLNTLGSLGRIRYWYLLLSAGVQANLEGIHTNSRPMCEILHKMSGGFLSLHLAGVYHKAVMLLFITTICATEPGSMS